MDRSAVMGFAALPMAAAFTSPAPEAVLFYGREVLQAARRELVPERAGR
jgi:hypothetical protein